MTHDHRVQPWLGLAHPLVLVERHHQRGVLGERAEVAQGGLPAGEAQGSVHKRPHLCGEQIQVVPLFPLVGLEVHEAPPREAVVQQVALAHASTAAQYHELRSLRRG